MANYLVTNEELTSLADVIREKSGKTGELIWPEDYSKTIENISTKVVSVPSKDVDFYDYDGTRVYSYTTAEFLALEEMPANPDHSHDAVPLTSQGWNWSLTDAKAYVATYGGLVVGQTYIPADGKTHILITIQSNAPYARRNFILHFGQTVSHGVTINWGDGTSETFSDTTTTTHTHQYTDTGEYDITLAVTSGSLLFTGASGSTINGIYGPQNVDNSYRRQMITAVYIGPDVTSIGDYAVSYCDMLKEFSIPNGVTSIGSGVFEACYGLECVVLPNGLTSIGASCFNNCNGVKATPIPKTLTQFGETALGGNRSQYRVTLPEGITEYPNKLFSDCRGMAFSPIPNTVTSIGTAGLSYCFCLLNVTVPSSVSSVGTFAFQRCCALEYHFKRATPPTLANSNVFTNTSSDFIIYVPRGSLNAYKTATNWSTYANHIQEEPE